MVSENDQPEKSFSYRRRKLSELKPNTKVSPSETSNDAPSANDSNGPATENPAMWSMQGHAITKTPSRQLPSSLSDMLQEIRTTDRELKYLINTRKLSDAKIPKEDLKNVIMARIVGGIGLTAEDLTLEEIDRMGVCLIKHLCVLGSAAKELGMSPQRLKWLITHIPEMEVYYEIAHEGIKNLVDEKVLANLQAGDKDTIKMVFNKMYAGRNKGGYNIAELGTQGYNDPLSKQIAAETENDRKQGNVSVVFNFIEKEIKTEFEQITVEGEVIDADESD
jgi:hypothetical protein